MKKAVLVLKKYINGIHPMPFWVLVLFLYAAIAAYTVCSALAFHPELLAVPDEAPRLSAMWFEAATGFIAAGAVCAPVMDLILRKDGFSEDK